jgi:large subunit ribosomal protein L22
VLRSAIANASQKDGFGGDVERLYVNACYANQGPSQKRIRPAPMGRAFRVLKRTAHLTVQVAERPLHLEIAPAAPPQPGSPELAPSSERAASSPKRPRGAKPKPKAKAAAKGRGKTGSKTGGAKKKAAAKGGRAKKAKA